MKISSFFGESTYRHHSVHKLLDKSGRHVSELTSGFCEHEWRPVPSPILMNSFGVKYQGKNHAKYLIDLFEGCCKMVEDWHGEIYTVVNLS